MPGTVLLIDGHNMTLRPWFAQSGKAKLLPDPAGVAGVVAKQVASWCDVLGAKPEHAIITFDATQGVGWRDELFPEYKANRRKSPPAPEAQQSQRDAMVAVRAVLGAMGVREVTAPGWEADDVIATLARLVGEQSRRAVIISSDRDLIQCVNMWVAVASPAAPIERGSVISERRWHAERGWPARLMADFKAMTGDVSDNIPPAGGMGEKSADQLLRTWGGVDDIYTSLAEVEATLGKRVRNALVENQSTLLRNLLLTRCRTDVPGVRLPNPVLPPATVVQPGRYLLIPRAARLRQVDPAHPKAAAVKPEDAAAFKAAAEGERPTVYQIEAVCPADEHRPYEYARARVISVNDKQSGQTVGRLVIWPMAGLLTTLAYEHGELTDQRPAWLGAEATRVGGALW